jgi:hypothetical protein
MERVVVVCCAWEGVGLRESNKESSSKKEGRVCREREYGEGLA